MKTLICSEPGNLEYITSATPSLQSGNSLLKIERIGICGTDIHAYQGTQPYFNYPRVLGHELAATVIDPGDARGFTPGETVTIIPYFNCGECIACRTGKPNCCVNIKVFGVHLDGGMREYVSVPSSSLIKSNGLSLDQLALVEPISIGAHGLRRAGIQTNEFVLVIGAGPIGLGTMELAGRAGAKVIAMDLSEQKLAFCRNELKISHTINAGQEDIVQRLRQITNGDMPTVVIDATGSLKAINDSLQFLAHGGRLVLIGLQKEAFSFGHPEFHKRETTLLSSRNATRADFDFVINAIARDEIDPLRYVTHRTGFEELKDQFSAWADPNTGVIKAMVTFHE